MITATQALALALFSLTGLAGYLRATGNPAAL